MERAPDRSRSGIPWIEFFGELACLTDLLDHDESIVI